MRILIVEDEVELRAAIAARLRRIGHAVDEAGDATQAEVHLHVYDHDLVILDRMLPDGDAIVHLRRWRNGEVVSPVLILTALDRVEDRVSGFEAGADDYLVKPFAMDELVARVQAILRRGIRPRTAVQKVGDLAVDSARREVSRAGIIIPLRPKEYALLELLVSHAGQVVTRAQIIDGCWDEAADPSSNVEEVVIAALRRKLGRPPIIETVRGAGYRIEDHADDR